MRLLLILCLLFSGALRAQDSLWFHTGMIYAIKTSDDITYSGIVSNEDTKFVTIQEIKTREKTELRKTAIVSYARINDRDAYEEIILGKFIFARQAIFTNAAFLFDPDELHGNNQWLLLDHIDYPLNENVAISSSAFAIFPLSVGIRTHFEVKKKVYLGAHAFVIGDLFNLASEVSPLWGWGTVLKATTGTSNRHITATAGLVGINNALIGLSGTSRPFSMLPYIGLSGGKRFTPKVALTAEAIYLPTARSFVTGSALKFVVADNLCIGLGAFGLVNQNNTYFQLDRSTLLPYLSFERKF